MIAGPFILGAPLALLGLIALPVIWFILRATPPAPQEADLPSLRLLDDVDPQDVPATEQGADEDAAQEQEDKSE